MAIILNDNLKIGVGAPIDSKYLNNNNQTYTNKSEVTSTISISQRYKGLTVNINNIEYWFKDGVLDSDLILKSGGGSGERIEKLFTKTNHGFVVGDVVAYSGNTFIKAIASGITDSETLGFISKVDNNNEFTVVFAGYINNISTLGLNGGSTYYLSTTNAGGLTNTPSNELGTIRKPILFTLTSNEALVFNYIGYQLSSGNSSNGDNSSIIGITEIENIGTGSGEIFSNNTSTVNGVTSSLRSLLASGGTTITTSGDTIIINSETNTSNIYSLESPSTVEVGGLPVGSILTGKTSNEILEKLLIKIYTPTFINPILESFTVNNETFFTAEIGTTASTLTFNTIFDRGDIILNGINVGFRSGVPSTYSYTNNGNVNKALATPIISSLLSNQQVLNDVIILSGSNTWNSNISYNIGIQPVDSVGNNSSTPLPAGTTSNKSATINGIYPWFYGKFNVGAVAAGVDRPTGNDIIISDSTKVLESSNNTIIVSDFNSTSQDYIWFAIPESSNSKTSWYVDSLNNGLINSINSNNLFSDPDVVLINSPDGYWSNISYKIYISNVQTIASSMEFRNN